MLLYIWYIVYVLEGNYEYLERYVSSRYLLVTCFFIAIHKRILR